MPITILGYTYPDPTIHDSQHWWASIAGLIAGATLFVTYYFFTRIESNGSFFPKQENNKDPPRFPWAMPWYYFVIGILLASFAVSGIACVLSTAVRPR